MVWIELDSGVFMFVVLSELKLRAFSSSVIWAVMSVVLKTWCECTSRGPSSWPSTGPASIGAEGGGTWLEVVLAEVEPQELKDNEKHIQTPADQIRSVEVSQMLTQNR